jgi:fluoroquinolone resistance protein
VCNLSLVKIEGCRLQDVNFEECKIVGAEFNKCDKRFFSIKAKNSFLQYANFADLNMKRGSFYGCKLRECYFTDTNLVEADFRETDLAGTVFHNSDLSKADFAGSKNYEIDVRTNKVKKAKFSFPEAIGLLRGFEVEIV